MKNIHRASNNLSGPNHEDVIFSLLMESPHLKEPKKRRNFDVIETRVNKDGMVIKFESMEGGSLKTVIGRKPLRIIKNLSNLLSTEEAPHLPLYKVRLRTLEGNSIKLDVSDQVLKSIIEALLGLIDPLWS